MSKPRRVQPKPTHAVIYLRVSTERQAESGLGLEAQERACREAAARLGLPVLNVHTDAGISGKEDVAGRPGLQAALAEVQAKGTATLVVYELSRLARTQRILWNLLDVDGDYALPIVSATQPFETMTPMGRAMMGMIGVWSQLESDMTGERTRAAMAAAAARPGAKKAGRPNLIESMDEDNVRVIDPKKVALIAKIQKMYASGDFTHRSLADLLNAKGIRSTQGGQWHGGSIYIALNMKLPVMTE